MSSRFASTKMNRGTRLVVVSILLLLFAGQVIALPPSLRLKKRSVSPAAAKTFVEASLSGKKTASHVLSHKQSKGNVLVVEADPELLIQSNSFDLTGLQIHFQPVSPGRFTYAMTTIGFDGTAAQTLSLKDDDSYELRFKNFQFPLGKKNYNRCYVNSNGNVTFQNPDPDPPNADSVTDGNPRISGLFDDLDPEGGGTIFINQTSDRVVISWYRVPEFFSQNVFDYGQNTFQIVLHNDGGIDLVYTTQITATQAFVGVVSGNVPLHIVDFTKAPVSNRPLRSFLENFHDYESINIPALMKVIYSSTPDRYDFVTLLSNFDLTPVPGAQAFALNVRNNVRGIGNPGNHTNPIFHDNAVYGSGKRLQNITFLGNLHGYPANIVDDLPDTDTSILSILAHEVAHRWLAYIRYPQDGKKSKVLLGRDGVHWSFFLDSQGSFLEGNDISQKSSNSFQTLQPFTRYSDLDLYLMGLLSPAEVHDTFYVDGATNFSPDFPFINSSTPEAGVRFDGTAIPVQIGNVIQANGGRKPAAGQSQNNFTHLFVLIDKHDTPATSDEVAYIDLLRTMWENFFSAATGKRATVDTTIQ